MAISSVTKRFVINDDKTCIALAKALRKSRKCIQKNPRIYSQINAYEKGKIKLEKYLALYQKH
ncbi:hypothetical protein [Ruminobacter amylophilus]|uniref:hypothetical protein n=1 Tax=Ruminobacter amylophilus TaxID=867 RepID=UPI00386395B4